VLGSPVSHSLSPALHLAAYRTLGLTWWRYEAIECGEADLPAFLDSCGPDWAGLSLTMPLKRAVLPLLDRAEPLVTEVGAANTVVLAAAQRLGYNTDVPGMARALAEHIAPADLVGPDQPALILGGGATACAALAALRDLGWRRATVAVRDRARTTELRAAAARLAMSIEVTTLGAPVLGAARLIISALPAGAADLFAHDLASSDVAPRVVLDVVYHPWPTPLAKAAGEVGAVVVGGFDLLLHQAALQVELLTGRPAQLEEMRRAGMAELSRRQSGTINPTVGK
jgi:shikimate dehydrogenase